MPELAIEGCFGNIFGFDSDLMVCAVEVDFGEVFCISKFVDEFIYSGEWIAVFDCKFIEGAVVNTEAEGTIFLFGEEDGSTPWAGRGANVTKFGEFT